MQYAQYGKDELSKQYELLKAEYNAVLSEGQGQTYKVNNFYVTLRLHYERQLE